MTLRSLRTRAATAALSTVAVAALAAGLAGCTSGGDTKPSASASATASEQAAITDVETPAGGSGGYVGAKADVTVTSCKRSGSSWAIAGSVKNPEKSAQGYRIYVSLLKGSSDTRAVKEVDVASVDAGASQDWKTSVDTSESGLSCVLRVERFAA